jgi:hypothetical protein
VVDVVRFCHPGTKMPRDDARLAFRDKPANDAAGEHDEGVNPLTNMSSSKGALSIGFQP